jgi:low affinity Fe/Cu permease
MVCIRQVIQNTQNREAKVMQLKLDELIRAVRAARTELVRMEALTDEELEALEKEFQAHRDDAPNSLARVAESLGNQQKTSR